MSRALRTAREVRVGPMIRSKSLSVEVWISLTMPVPMTTVPHADGGGDPVELVLQERQGLGHPDDQDVDPVRRGVARGQQPDRVLVETVPGEVGEGRPPGQVGVADLDGPVCGQRGGERSPPVPHDRDRPREVDRARLGVRQLPEQVFVGGVPRPEGVARVLGEAGELESAL